MPKYFLASASSEIQVIVLQGCILFQGTLGNAVALLERFSIIAVAKYTV